jgi:hypothetical protein
VQSDSIESDHVVNSPFDISLIGGIGLRGQYCFDGRTVVDVRICEEKTVFNSASM